MHACFTCMLSRQPGAMKYCTVLTVHAGDEFPPKCARLQASLVSLLQRSYANPKTSMTQCSPPASCSHLQVE